MLGRAAGQLTDSARRQIENLRHFLLRKAAVNCGVDFQIADLTIALFVIRVTEGVKNLNLSLQASYLSLQFTHSVVGHSVAHDIITLLEDGGVCRSPLESAQVLAGIKAGFGREEAKPYPFFFALQVIFSGTIAELNFSKKILNQINYL